VALSARAFCSLKVSGILLGAACLSVLAWPWADEGGAASLGDVGNRSFPVTLAVEDPLVIDALTFPSILHIKRPGTDSDPATRETTITGSLFKRLTPNLGLGLSGALIHLDPDGQPSLTGFDNLDVELKYQVVTSERHEAILALGLDWQVGGTGRNAVGAQSFDVVTPAVFIGKGFGDLQETFGLLRPLALTGLLGVQIPTRDRTKEAQPGLVAPQTERHPNVLEWGVVVEYSLPYLQGVVGRTKIPAFLDRMVPVVELACETRLDRGGGGRTTGTVNPGIIWEGRFFQVGIEAVVPINDRTGKTVGIRAQLDFFLDELFPESLGRPLFGSPLDD
jgi:hypothetical protein